VQTVFVGTVSPGGVTGEEDPRGERPRARPLYRDANLLEGNQKKKKYKEAPRFFTARNARKKNRKESSVMERGEKDQQEKYKGFCLRRANAVRLARADRQKTLFSSGRFEEGEENVR